MTNIVVSRGQFMNCYNTEYIFGRPDETNEYLLEQYGIDHWIKIDLDNIKITFIDEKKMTYWMLKWL